MVKRQDKRIKIKEERRIGVLEMDHRPWSWSWLFGAWLT